MKSLARIATFLVLGIGAAAALAQQPKPAATDAEIATRAAKVAVQAAGTAVDAAQVAVDAKQAKAPANPPAIPPDILKRFWQADDAQQRAQRDLEHAQLESQAANDEWKKAVKELNDACGEKHVLKQDVSGQDPYCAVKPPEAKPAEPAKK
jgi:hypothetical protein